MQSCAHSSICSVVYTLDKYHGQYWTCGAPMLSSWSKRTARQQTHSPIKIPINELLCEFSWLFSSRRRACATRKQDSRSRCFVTRRGRTTCMIYVYAAWCMLLGRNWTFRQLVWLMAEVLILSIENNLIYCSFGERRIKIKSAMECGYPRDSTQLVYNSAVELRIIRYLLSVTETYSHHLAPRLTLAMRAHAYLVSTRLIWRSQLEFGSICNWSWRNNCRFVNRTSLLHERK